MSKVMIYGPSIDLYITVTDEQADRIYDYMLNNGIARKDE